MNEYIYFYYDTTEVIEVIVAVSILIADDVLYIKKNINPIKNNNIGCRIRAI